MNRTGWAGVDSGPSQHPNGRNWKWESTLKSTLSRPTRLYHNDVSDDIVIGRFPGNWRLVISIPTLCVCVCVCVSECVCYIRSHWCQSMDNEPVVGLVNAVIVSGVSNGWRRQRHRQRRCDGSWRYLNGSPMIHPPPPPPSPPPPPHFGFPLYPPLYPCSPLLCSGLLPRSTGLASFPGGRCGFKSD